MTRYLVLLAYSFCFLQCTAKKKHNDWTVFELKDKVKSITEYSYICPIKFGKADTTILEKYIERFNIYMTEYQFDTEGFLIEEKSFFEDGSLDERQAYRYSEVNEIKVKIEKNRYKVDGILFAKTTYEYDQHGNLIKEVSEFIYNGVPDGAKGVSKFKYDDKNNLIEKRYANQDSIVVTYFYDKYLNLSTKHVLFGSDLTKFNYQYDKDEIMLSEDRIDSDGKIEKTVYRYDNKKNNIEVFDVTKDKITTQNFFDGKNNIVSFISYPVEEDNAKFTKRDIKYY